MIWNFMSFSNLYNKALKTLFEQLKNGLAGLEILFTYICKDFNVLSITELFHLINKWEQTSSTAKHFIFC
jgi:hypothetical protein